jgi:PAS domain S-box-containing protein
VGWARYIEVAPEVPLQEERLFRALMESSYEAVALVTADGTILYASPSAARALGYSPDEWIGRSGFAGVHPEDLPGVQALFLGLLQNPGGSVSAEYRFQHRDGSWRWIESTGTNLLHDPHVQAVVVNYRDISKRKRFEEELRESERRFRELTENIREVFWISDPQKEALRYVSPAYEVIWGRSRESLYEHPRSFLETIHPDDLPRVEAYLDKQRHGEAAEAEYRVVHPDGSVRWVLDRAFPLAEREGTPSRIVGVAEDITERKLAEQALRDSEERYRRIVETATEGIAVYGPDACLRYLNRPLAEMLGYRMGDLVGLSVLDLFFPEDRPGIEERLERRRRGMGERYETRLRRRDGSAVWVLINSNPMVDEAGQFAGVLVTFTDLTERKRTEDALRGSEARLSGIISSAMDAIVTIDEEQRITVFNAAAEAMFRCPAEEALGQPVERFIPEEFRPAHRQHVAAFGAAGVTTRTMGALGTLFALRADGEVFPIEATISQVSVDGARFYSVIIRDVTERVRLEAELRKRAELLAEADRRKDEFLAMLGHELRNPLAAIGNAVYVLDQVSSQEEQPVRLRRVIAAQTAHLARLVDDLLDVSRLVHGKVELRREPVDLTKVVAGAVEVCQPLIMGKGHRLEVVPPPDADCWTLGDRTRLEQVLTNLLTNAARYTPPEGNIRLTLDGGADEVTLRVRDTGMGIPEELLPRIFDLFIQGPQAADRPSGGLGLGLALTQRLVLLHGGSVEAHSDGPGKGSEFVVRLPRLQPADAPALDTPAARGGPRRGHRILVVEDNRAAAETLCDLLALWGHEVAVVHTGTDAVTTAIELAVDIALVDIGLPGMDGCEIAAQLRSDPRTASMLLIAITGYGQAADRFVRRKPASTTISRSPLTRASSRPCCRAPEKGAGETGDGEVAGPALLPTCCPCSHNKLPRSLPPRSCGRVSPLIRRAITRYPFWLFIIRAKPDFRATDAAAKH